MDLAIIAIIIEAVLLVITVGGFLMYQARKFGHLETIIHSNLEDNANQWGRISKIDRRLARIEGKLQIPIPGDDNGN